MNVNETVDFLLNPSIMTIEEGLGSAIVGNFGDGIARIPSDISALLSNFDNNVDSAIIKLDRLDDYIKRHPMVLDHQDSGYVSFLNTAILWRFSLFVRNDQYQKMLEAIKSGDSVKGMWIDTKFSNRGQDLIKSTKDTKGLLNISQLLRTRFNELSRAIHTAKAKGQNPKNSKILGMVVIGGADDFAQLAKACIRYSD